MSTSGIFLCGKMAAGKSTLAQELAHEENAVLLVQDELLNYLFPGEITDIPGFDKVLFAIEERDGLQVCALLSRGMSVVLDFPGIQGHSAFGSVSSSSAPMLSMNCTS